MSPTETPAPRTAQDYKRELAEVRDRITERKAELADDVRHRNLLMYHGILAGLTERDAADAAGVSYGLAGQAKRGKGDPAKGKEPRRSYPDSRSSSA